MNSMFKHLIMCRIYFIATWTGLGCVVGWFLCIFYAYVVVCTILHHASSLQSNIHCFWQNRSMQSSSTPIVLLQPPYHHLYIQDDAHNILCISCVHFYVNYQYHIQSTSTLPNHTIYAAGYVLPYLMMIVVHHHTYSTNNAPCRVVNLT